MADSLDLYCICSEEWCECLNVVTFTEEEVNKIDMDGLVIGQSIPELEKPCKECAAGRHALHLDPERPIQ